MGDEFGGVTEEEDDDNQAQQVGHRVFTAVPRADRIVLGAVSTNKINYWRIVVYSSRVFCLLIFISRISRLYGHIINFFATWKMA